MELIKEPFKIEQLIGEESLQFSVQGDLIIPDVKPDILKVFCNDSDVVIENKEIMQDKVLVEGTVNFKIIYLSNNEGSVLRSLNASMNFKEPIEVRGLKPNMMLSMTSNVLNTDFEFLNERKIFVKSMVQIGVKATDPVDINLLTDVSDIEAAETLREPIRINSFIGQGTENVTLNFSVQIPPEQPAVYEILRNDAKLDKEIKLYNNTAEINGQLLVSTKYTGDNLEKSVHMSESSVPFSHEIMIAGVTDESLCDMDAIIKDVNVSVEDDEDNESKMLEYKISLDVTAKASQWVESNVVSDIYSPNVKLEPEIDKVDFHYLAGETNRQLNLKSTFDLPFDEEVNEIYSMICTPAAAESKVVNDKLAIEGLIDVWILYAANGNEKMVHKSQIPFNTSLEAKDIPLAGSHKIKADVQQSSHNLLHKSAVDTKITLGLNIKAYNQQPLSFITKINQMPKDEDERLLQPSITIYYSQLEDNLWKIAKKFNTTAKELRKINNLPESDQILPGQQIVILKPTHS
jgi:hypothetical protein